MTKKKIKNRQTKTVKRKRSSRDGLSQIGAKVGATPTPAALAEYRGEQMKALSEIADDLSERDIPDKMDIGTGSPTKRPTIGESINLVKNGEVPNTLPVIRPDPAEVKKVGRDERNLVKTPSPIGPVDTSDIRVELGYSA